MNIIEARIKNIKVEGSIHLVDLSADDLHIRMMSLELDPKFCLDCRVRLMFKETEVTLLLANDAKVSVSNVWSAEITRIASGKILSEVFVSVGKERLSAILTEDAVKDLSLKAGLRVQTMVKASDISMELW